MPPRPTFKEKINSIVRFIEDPCDAPWIVYLELARVPLRDALLTWYTFGLTDVMRGYFRPRGLRGRRHGRGRGRGVKKVGALALARASVPGLGDDMGNFVGKILPGAEAKNQRHVSQGVKNLWFIDGVLQRGLWWWLIIGITTDFLYEWTTLLQQSEFCKRTHQKGMLVSGPTGGALAIQGWITQAGMLEQRNHGGAVWSNPIMVLDAGNWTVVSSLSMTQFGNPGASTHESRLINVLTQQTIGFSDGVTVQKDGVSQTIATADVVGPIWVSLQGKISFGAAAGDHGDIWATGETTP